jgi:hypothetical protein
MRALKVLSNENYQGSWGVSIDSCYSAWSALLQIGFKPWGGIDSYTTSKDQFAAERYIRYNSDTVAPHSVITGIADVRLH